MSYSLIEIGLKTAEKNSAQTNRQTDRHYENNGHLAVNQLFHFAVHAYANYSRQQRLGNVLRGCCDALSMMLLTSSDVA